MKTVQTFLLFILLIAVGPYPQVVFATGIEIEPTEAWTDKIQLEGLTTTTVTPNAEIQNEEKFTAAPVEPQNTVIILQLSIESNITVNSSSNDSVQPTFPTSTTPSSTSNSEITADKIDETVTTAESESIVYIPEANSTPESAADLPLPISSSSLESVSTDTESKSTTGVPELEPTTETSLVSSSTEAAQIIEEPKNTTDSPGTSSASESSSKSPIPSTAGTESKCTNDVPQSRSTTEAVPSISESILETTEVAETTSDSENTSSIPLELSSASESASESSLPEGLSSAESIQSSIETTQKSSDSENTLSISPEASVASESGSESQLSTSPSSAESIIKSKETNQTHSNSENTSSIPTESDPDIESSSQSSLLTVSSASETIPVSTETTLSPTQLSEGSTTVESTESKLNSVNQIIELGLGDTENASGTEKTVATKHGEVDSTPSVPATQSGTVSEPDVGPSKTAESQNNEQPDGVLVVHLPSVVPVSSSISETDQTVATRTETTDVVTISNTETPETLTGPVATPSHTPEDPLNPSEVTAAPSTAPESDPASSLPTDPTTSESIPASTETAETSSDFKTTSSTPSESSSTSESASEPPVPPVNPESTSPSIEASAPIPCNETGNFPNPANCLTYISCTGNTTYLLSQEIQCPDRSAFSPVLQRCTRDISPCNEEPPCSYAGSIADPTNSSLYYWCVPSILGGFHKYHIQCSIDEAFNALFGRCFLKTPTYGLIKPSSGIPNDRDIAKAESKQMKKEIKAKAKEEKNRQKMAAKAKADAEKLALKQQKKQNYCLEEQSDD